MNTNDTSPWVRRAVIGLVALATAAAIAVPVVLALDDDRDSATPGPPASSTSPAPSAEVTSEPTPDPVDEASDDVIPPVPLDLAGVSADLDGDGSADALHVDTFPNTDGVTTSYKLWAELTSTGREVSSQMTGETPNYVSFKGVVDTDGDGRDEVVLLVTPGGDLASAHVHGLVGRNLQLLEWPDDTARLQVYESGDDADNVWIHDDRLLSGATTTAGRDWQMWEWILDGPSLFPTSLGSSCGEEPATTPPLDAC
jgi:hypothetical protein